MLKSNTFRSSRYQRSKYTEGKFLLASEATDLELEVLDSFQASIIKNIGEEVAIGDGWKVERLTNTQLLINIGEAWIDGIPFSFKNSDGTNINHLISTDVLPLGVAADSYSGGNKKGLRLTFNTSTTPAADYRITIYATEQVITYADDEFLHNANIPESTAEKRRLVYKVNVIPNSDYTTTPVPYRGYHSATNKILENYIQITSSSLVGSRVYNPLDNNDVPLIRLDGRSIDLYVNSSSLSVFPQNADDREEFKNGTLVDSKGNIYHLISISNGVSSHATLRIGKEVGQAYPDLGTTYHLYKKGLFYTTTSSGNEVPSGKLYWNIANVTFTTSGFVHNSSISDLRSRILSVKDYKSIIDQKFSLTPTDGGDVTWEYSLPADSNILAWSGDVHLVNPVGHTQIIPASSAAMLDEGSLVYQMNLLSGGNISRSAPATTGTISVLATTSGSSTTITLNSVDLSLVRKGNVIRLNSSPYTIAYITNIDNIAHIITVSSAFNCSGAAATIYLDSFGPGQAPLDELSYVLAVRKGTKTYVVGILELESGEKNRIGDGVPQGTLDFIGSTGENDDSPFYTYTNYILQGSSLTTAISRLDKECKSINDILATPIYDERTLFPSSPPATGTTIVLPSNSRNSGLPQVFDPTDGSMEIYVNQLPKFQGSLGVADWYAYPETAPVRVKVTNIIGNDLYITSSPVPGPVDLTTIVNGESAVFKTNTVIKTITGHSTSPDIITVNNTTDIAINDILILASNHIKLNFDLPVDAEIHFRADTLGGNSVGGGGGAATLQDAYDGGNIITVASGTPVKITGAPGKQLWVTGSVQVDGVLDPQALQLTPQTVNPLGPTQRGLWTNSSDELVFERVTASAANITQQIHDLQTGFGVSALSTTFLNNQVYTIPKFTPVYSPVAGEIDIADGSDDIKSRVVGITTADIAASHSGTVVYIGKVNISPTSLIHGKFIYLGLTAGSMVDVAPTLLGGYPSGFDVILIGVLVGSELILRFQHVGTL